MADLDKDRLVTEVVLVDPDGKIDDGARVQLRIETIPFHQLPDGALFIDMGKAEVMQLRGGVVKATQLVLGESMVSYMCDDAGFGPLTGNPII